MRYLCIMARLLMRRWFHGCAFEVSLIRYM